MATKTADAAQSGVQPRSIETGVYPLVSTYTVSAATTLSAGDIILMGKIPHGATILGVQTNFSGVGASGSAGTVLGIGLQDVAGSLSALGSATGNSGIAWLAKGVPLTVSCSDDAVNQFKYLKIQVASDGTTTATGTLSLTVFLTRDK